MKKLILCWLGIVSVWSCKSSSDPFEGIEALPMGIYDVQLYVLNGDTLYYRPSINKIEAGAFYIEPYRTKTDSISLITTVNRPGNLGQTVAENFHGLEKTRSGYKWSAAYRTDQEYWGKIQHDTLYQKKSLHSSGWITLPSNYQIKDATSPQLEGITIVATKR